MANIREYTNPIDKLNPTDLGFTARETAARRIGPLAKETAADIEKGGRLQGELFSQAEKDQALAVKALDEGTVRGGRGGGGGGGGGGGIIGVGGGRGGGGGGYARPDPQWADTANQVTYTALALSGGSKPEDRDAFWKRALQGPPEDLTGGGGNPTTGASWSDRTHEDPGGAGGDWSHHEDDTGPSPLWPVGDFDAKGNPTEYTGPGLWQPLAAGYDQSNIGAPTPPAASGWDNMVGLASRGFSAITSAATLEGSQ